MTAVSSCARNLAIIAHVDHGKTTLVDALLKQSGTLLRGESGDRLMDSNDLERERGITILSKNTAIVWQDQRINIVDTPGHADFGGEVERVLSMVDAVLLVVDAVDGPMPQTRFVTQKAFACGLKPLVVVNKIDRPSARPDWVVDQVFDLFDTLGGTSEQLDFPVVYASALQGYAVTDPNHTGVDLKPLFEMLCEHVPVASGDPEAPLQMQITSLDHSPYMGSMGIGCIRQGRLRAQQVISVVSSDASSPVRAAKVSHVLGYMGLHRTPVDAAQAGDIVAVAGIEGIRISDTLCDPQSVVPLPALSVDEPTISTVFAVNDSPFVGQEGKFVTSRHLKERLDKELLHNVALRVEPGDTPDRFRVSGRGELHLSILIENMRREGYELLVGRPDVIVRHDADGQRLEPYEELVVDMPSEDQGAVIQALGERRGQLVDMQTEGTDRVRVIYELPARCLIGFHMLLQNLTGGRGVWSHRFLRFGPWQSGDFGRRKQGVLIANGAGKTTAYALFHLESRGRLFVKAQTPVYEGMIVGQHARDNDLVVNAVRAKQLTNVRASGSDEHLVLSPPWVLSLEQALGYIDADEWVEVTPKSIRLRKKELKEHARRRHASGRHGSTA